MTSFPPDPLVAALSVELWQAIFGIGALAIVVYHFWDGWSSGLTRKLFTLLALLVAITVGWFGASTWAGFVAEGSPIPRPLLNVVAGTVAGLSTFIVMLLLTLFLTEPTRKKKDAGTRLIWGLGGGLLGLLIAGVWLIILAALIRFTGTLAEAGLTLHNLSAQAEDEGPANAEDNAHPVYIDLALRAAEAIENLPLAGLLEAFDPVPDKAHRLVEKMARITTDREALYWLGQDAATKLLLENETLAQAINDPQIRELARENRFQELMTHPRIKELAEDEALLQQASSFDFEGALDRAWERRDETPTLTDAE